MNLAAEKSRITSETFLWDERPELNELIARLVDAQVQFAVALDPQDIRNAERTGWVVSYRAMPPTPEGQAA